MPLPAELAPPDPQQVAPGGPMPDINTLTNPAQAVPAQGMAPNPAPQQSPIKRLLTNFTTGMGQAMMKQAGIPLPEEVRLQQAQTAALTASAIHTQAQTDMMKNTIPFQLPNGMTAQLPQALAEKLMQQQLANQGKENVARTNKRYITTPQGLIDTQTLDANGFPTTIPGTAQGIQVTPEIQRDYGLSPELVGRFVKPGELAQLGRTASGQISTVSGAQGPAVVNKVQAAQGTGKAQSLGLGNPGVAVAGARAAVTPFQTFDSEGNLVTTSAAEAIKAGAPSASAWQSIYGPTSSTKSAGQAAGAVTSHIPNLRAEIATLGSQGKLGPVMGRINEYMNSGYGGSDPVVAQFVSDMKLMNSGTVRAHFGARGGAQVLEQFNRILNTSQTPEAINGSLNAIESWLSKYGDIGTAKGPKTSIGAGAANQGGETQLLPGPDGKMYKVPKENAAKFLRDVAAAKGKK